MVVREGDCRLEGSLVVCICYNNINNIIVLKTKCMNKKKLLQKRFYYPLINLKFKILFVTYFFSIYKAFRFNLDDFLNK